MRANTSSVCCLIFTVIQLTFDIASGSTFRNRAEVWGNELTGESDEAIVTDNERESYKQNLLQYVFRTEAPTSAQLNREGVAADVPFVMNKLYELLADKDTGREKRSTPFDVDLIRGFEDYWGKYMYQLFSKHLFSFSSLFVILMVNVQTANKFHVTQIRKLFHFSMSVDKYRHFNIIHKEIYITNVASSLYTVESIITFITLFAFVKFSRTDRFAINALEGGVSRSRSQTRLLPSLG